MIKFIFSVVWLTAFAIQGGAQVTFTLGNPSYVDASAGNNNHNDQHIDYPTAGNPNYSMDERANDPATPNQYDSSNSFAHMDFSLTSYSATVHGNGNATTTNYASPSVHEQATAASLFAVTFTVPQESQATISLDSSGVNYGTAPVFYLADSSAQQYLMREPLGYSGTIYNIPLIPGHQYYFAAYVYIGVGQDGAFSGTASYDYSEDLVIHALPEPSTLTFGGATFLTGVFICFRKFRRA